MLADLLPPGAVAVERRDDDDPAPLFPVEEAAVAGAVAKRRQEFATTRRCARDALALLGLPAVPLPRGPNGGPVWPDGIVGSLTHCAGYRAAAVARASDVPGLGIDAEPDEPLPAGVLDLVSDPDERAGLPEGGGPCWDRLLFCAKEALYKAWSPLTGRWLGFEEARVAFSADGTFDVRVLANGAGERTRFEGRWEAAPGLLIASVTVNLTG
ncbi:4'-phosphopantetheinyl transferase superfamily protein [Asanoa sp. NPDC049518]|uniref:4'-phosphopantetheinyl transferase family protein n=1 Tax=unclassified Asanoa TaxID=2685164 RepID=UPI00342B0182